MIQVCFSTKQTTNRFIRFMKLIYMYKAVREVVKNMFLLGEDVLISLYGGAQDANVRLDKNSIRIENTYISMANQRTVTIHNRSDIIAHFRWTQFATKEEEDQQKFS